MTDFQDFYRHIEDWCDVRLGVADRYHIRKLIAGFDFMSQDWMISFQNSVDFLCESGFESHRLYALRDFYHDANRQFAEAALREVKRNK